MYFKILVSEQKYKNDLKSPESQQTNIFYNSHILYVMFMECFATKSNGFAKILKVKNLRFFKSVLSSRRENIGPVTKDHVKSFQIRNERP